MRETNRNFDSCNSCKRLVPSRLHELHESKFPFVSRIEFIRSKLSNFSAHVYGVIVQPAPTYPNHSGVWIRPISPNGKTLIFRNLLPSNRTLWPGAYSIQCPPPVLPARSDPSPSPSPTPLTGAVGRQFQCHPQIPVPAEPADLWQTEARPGSVWKGDVRHWPKCQHLYAAICI